MVKILKNRKIHKKKVEKKRFRKKIKFIRRSGKKAKSYKSENQTNCNTSISSKDSNKSFNSKNSETDCLDLSLINWSKIFLQENSFPFEITDKFTQNFFNILKKLYLKENEFVEWILYIEYYISKKSVIDIETLHYIGLYVKKLLGSNSNDNTEHLLKTEKKEEINNILKGKKISFIELNNKYHYFCKYTKQKQNYYYNIVSMIDFICEENTNVKKKHKKEIKNKIIEEKEEEKKKEEIKVVKNNQDEIKEKQENEPNHNIEIASNRLENEPMFDENNDMDEENEEKEMIHWQIEDIDQYDNERLQGGDIFMKLDSSIGNLDNNLKMCFAFNNYFLKQ